MCRDRASTGEPSRKSHRCECSLQASLHTYILYAGNTIIKAHTYVLMYVRTYVLHTSKE